MKRPFYLTAAALSLMFAPGIANAGIQYFDISRDNSQGAFTAHVAVDVVNGLAVSGTGFIGGAGFNAPETLTLITLATPGGNWSGTVGWQSNGGDNVTGFNDVVPVTAAGGLLFVANPIVTNGLPVGGTGLDFGFWNNGPTGYGNDYQAAFYGTSDDKTQFYKVDRVVHQRLSSQILDLGHDAARLRRLGLRGLPPLETVAFHAGCRLTGVSATL